MIGVVSEADMLNKEALVLNYPPAERLGGRYDVVANFPMD